MAMKKNISKALAMAVMMSVFAGQAYADGGSVDPTGNTYTITIGTTSYALSLVKNNGNFVATDGSNTWNVDLATQNELDTFASSTITNGGENNYTNTMKSPGENLNALDKQVKINENGLQLRADGYECSFYQKQ